MQPNTEHRPDAGPSGYFLLISIHGLIRGHDLELGRDADTGGQTKYVVELARSLAAVAGDARVELVTRRIVDPKVSDDYAVRREPVAPNFDIVRIDCGPGEYIAKEKLWDYLDEFTDNLYAYLQERQLTPRIVHSHYADAGYVGVRLSNGLGVPLVHTGHSLGRDKRKRLLAKGMSATDIEDTYNIARRIDAEEVVLANADLIITSTQQEILEQYELYSHYDPSRMTVIPPGVDLTQFRPPAKDEDFPFAAEIDRFLTSRRKPLILALSRPDERKNFMTLIESYGQSPELQEAANLLIVAGTRDDIRDLDTGARAVLTSILLLTDAFDLYGKVAIPKHHTPDDIPKIYRLVAKRRGVFVNPALTEPFGLTLLEAAASGLPVVATENGGPVDIVANCENGELVDPLDPDAISTALLGLLSDRTRWQRASKNGIAGVARHYTWEAHAERYLEQTAKLKEKYRPVLEIAEPVRVGRYRDRALFTDLDLSLIGDDDALDAFKALIRSNHRRLIFGIATGRRFDSALSGLRDNRIPMPDVLITSLGTRIHYGPGLSEDLYWADHIDVDWSSERVQRGLSGIDGLRPQSRLEQSRFKVSYYYDARIAPPVDEIVDHLRRREVTANVVHSFGQFLDVVPSRASKGQALRYVAHRLEIPLERVLVAGGSGADEDMMRGIPRAVVVGNRHREELSDLTGLDGIYYAKRPFAAGILEAIEHYDFLNT